MPISVEPVKLKPFLGMEPGLYLTVLYGTIFLVVLFLVAILPGILHSGKQVTFSSLVEPAIVSVDGKYIGSAPVTAFIEPGNHQATFSYDGVGEIQVNFSVGHPVFLTWLFPRTQEVSSNSFLEDIPAFRKYLESMYKQVVDWSAVIEFNDTYHRPPLFRQVAFTALSLPFDQGEKILFEFLTQSLNQITSKTMLTDFTEGLSILKEQSVLDATQIDIINKHVEQIALLFNPEASSQQIGLTPTNVEVPMNRTSLEVPINGIAPITGFSYGQQDLVIGKQVALSYPGVHEMGIAKSVQPFTISALEVSEYLWAHFITANPYWGKSNSKQLIVDNKVDEMYLAGVYPTTSVLSNQPVRNISWYAALAFTEWLSDITGKNVFLPSVSQWEAGAQSVAESTYQTGTLAIVEKKGPSAMLGGYWEFTSDVFTPLERYTEIEATWNSPTEDIIIKGGSHLNDPSQIDRSTIGVMAPYACSETTGFRIAWTD